MMGRDVTVGAASLITKVSGVYAVLLTSTVLDGLLARSRINYLPKRVSLVSSEKGEVECIPRIPGLFHVLRRVRKLERPGGVYKGLMPMTLSLAVYLVGDNGMRRFLSSILSLAGLWSPLIIKLTCSIVGLPTMIIHSRSIVTPYRLPYFSPVRSLRVLLTSAERTAPWSLLFKPGLLAAQALHDLCTTGLLLPLRCVLVPAMSLPMSEMRWGTISPVRAGLLACVVLLSPSQKSVEGNRGAFV